MSNWKENVSFILVEPKEPGNIGACARVMKNMGFKNLCIVKPPAVMMQEARWFAHNSEDVLEGASVFHRFEDSIKEQSLIVGTTRRTGKRRGLIMTPEEGATRLVSTSHNNKVAILFGREDRGLLNEEIGECGFLISIPASKEHPSINLSHAVAIVAYELSTSGRKAQTSRQHVQEQNDQRLSFISHEELNRLYKRISESLQILEYTPRGDRDLNAKIMRNLKHFIARAGLTVWELKMLHGICSQIEKRIPRLKL
ncbi:MAG: RNA methyltransferase [Dissulfurispiraceae bacterium]